MLLSLTNPTGKCPAEYDRKRRHSRTIMHDPIDNFLAQRPMMVLDGAMATELERRGADLNDPLWSAKCLIERPDLIHEVHLDYFRAGADVATTATYQATYEAFAQRGVGGYSQHSLCVEQQATVDVPASRWGQQRCGILGVRCCCSA